jgi:hypothetical protein
MGAPESKGDAQVIAPRRLTSSSWGGGGGGGVATRAREGEAADLVGPHRLARRRARLVVGEGDAGHTGQDHAESKAR